MSVTAWTVPVVSASRPNDNGLTELQPHLHTPPLAHPAGANPPGSMSILMRRLGLACRPSTALRVVAPASIGSRRVLHSTAPVCGLLKGIDPLLTADLLHVLR